MSRRVPQLAIGFVAVVLGLAGCGGDASGPSGPSGPPVVVSINGATQPAGPAGSTIVIEGSNFGSAQGSSQVLFSNGLGGSMAAVIVNPGDWTNTLILTTVPAGAASGAVVVQTSLGSSPALTFTITQNAAFSPSTITWGITSDLPVALSGHALAYAQLGGPPATRFVWAIGGAGGGNAPVSTVYLATVGAGATLGAWTATAPLPAALAFHTAVAATPANSRITATGYLYVLGGATDAAGTPSSLIYRGALAVDGTVTAWTQLGTLPVPLHSLGAAVFHGDLYVVGGATSNNAAVATVYRSRITADGGLGAWQSLPALPFRRAHFGFGSFGGYLYTFGGDSGNVAPHNGSQSNTAVSDVAYARIDLLTGNLTTAGWTTAATKLTKDRSKHTAVAAGGNVLVTAGLYNGATSGSSEESYARLNVDGTLGSFNGATGSNTISTLLGGGNLFNHAAVTYLDGTGLLHVLVAGGDDANAPGTKHRGVYYY